MFKNKFPHTAKEMRPKTKKEIEVGFAEANRKIRAGELLTTADFVAIQAATRHLYPVSEKEAEELVSLFS